LLATGSTQAIISYLTKTRSIILSNKSGDHLGASTAVALLLGQAYIEKKGYPNRKVTRTATDDGKGNQR
jgi:hypothetical protein